MCRLTVYLNKKIKDMVPEQGRNIVIHDLFFFIQHLNIKL